jgi:hypothetical protein
LRGFYADGFYENWKYLPGRIGKIFLFRQILPGVARLTEISAGAYFPPQRKIDV